MAPERLSDTFFNRPFLVFWSGREAVAIPSAPEARPELFCVISCFIWFLSHVREGSSRSDGCLT